ncbi:MAG: hypothetical protein WCX61_00490 [Candidatus Peribacteraceae bacterium]|jgi:hypothetical protein
MSKLLKIIEEARLLKMSMRNDVVPGNEQEHDQVDITESDPFKEAENIARKAEEDSGNLQKRVDVAQKRVQETRESVENIQERISRLNERIETLNNTASESIKSVLIGRILTVRYGISSNGKTYGILPFRSGQERDILLGNKQETESDADGAIYEHHYREGYEYEQRTEGTRIYAPIEELEQCQEQIETRFNTKEIVEHEGYAAEFNKEYNVKEVDSLVEDDITTEAEDDKKGQKSSEEYKQHMQIAEKSSKRLKNIVERIPEEARKVNGVKLFINAKFAVDKNGVMLFVIPAGREKEFRAMPYAISNNVHGFTRQYKNGQYALEINPDSINNLLAQVELLYVYSPDRDRSQESENFDALFDEVRKNGHRLEAPIDFQKRVTQLGNHLDFIKQRYQQTSLQKTPAANFIRDIQLEATPDGTKVYFAHDTQEPILSFFQDSNNGDNFVSQHPALSSVSFKQKNKKYVSNDLSMNEADNLLSFFRTYQPEKTSTDESPEVKIR